MALGKEKGPRGGIIAGTIRLTLGYQKLQRARDVKDEILIDVRRVYKV
jgi:hypothetical protein